MQDAQLLRYSRHILLDEIGIEGQQRLLRSHALLIGAGGLGSAAAMYLASAGVGHITLVDNDQVDLTNLQRQIIHRTETIGWDKVRSAATTLHALNPEIRVSTVALRADAALLQSLVAQADVVLDGCDNFATRQAVNRACVEHRKPLVWGAALGFDGQIGVYAPEHGASPCYACLFPPDAAVAEHNCATMGVLSPLVGMVGSMQAAEALKCLLGMGTTLWQRLLLVDARSMEYTNLHTQRRQDCPVCAGFSSTHSTT